MSLHIVLLLTALLIFVHGKMYERWALRNVGYKRYFNVRACYAGEEVQMVEEISNRKLLPLPWLRLESLLDSGLLFGSRSNLDISRGDKFQHHRSLFSLMPYSQIRRKHRVLCLKRGCYDLRSATMTSGDLLGLFTTSKTFKFERETRLLVYPELLDVADLPLPSHNWQGDLSVRRWILEDPFQIAGVREYRYGDPLNAVNWKATARTGSLQVHRRDFTADHKIVIYLNIQSAERIRSETADAERIEAGIAMAASLARYCLSHAIPTGFGCNGWLVDAPKEPVRLPPSNEEAHLTELLDTMAMLVIGASEEFSVFLQYDLEQGTANTDFIILSSYISEEMDDVFVQLRKNGNSVQVLPIEGGPRFSDSSAEHPSDTLDGRHERQTDRDGAQVPPDAAVLPQTAGREGA